MRIDPTLISGSFADRVEPQQGASWAHTVLLTKIAVCLLGVVCLLSSACLLFRGSVDSERALITIEPPPNPAINAAPLRSLPRSEPNAADIDVGRSRTPLRSLAEPNRKAIYFKGRFEFGKRCIRTNEGGYALCKSEYFKVIQVIRASDEARGKLNNVCIDMYIGSRARATPEDVQAGTTYTVRLVPSEKTWAAIVKGDAILVSGDELEFVRSVAD
jgi:hypothetical protein